MTVDLSRLEDAINLAVDYKMPIAPELTLELLKHCRHATAMWHTVVFEKGVLRRQVEELQAFKAETQELLRMVVDWRIVKCVVCGNTGSHTSHCRVGLLLEVQP